jgi:hypothetical protein
MNDQELEREENEEAGEEEAPDSSAARDLGKLVTNPSHARVIVAWEGWPGQ